MITRYIKSKLETLIKGYSNNELPRLNDLTLLCDYGIFRDDRKSVQRGVEALDKIVLESKTNKEVPTFVVQ